MIVVNALK